MVYCIRLLVKLVFLVLIETDFMSTSEITDVLSKNLTFTEHMLITDYIILREKMAAAYCYIDSVRSNADVTRVRYKIEVQLSQAKVNTNRFSQILCCVL